MSRARTTQRPARMPEAPTRLDAPGAEVEASTWVPLRVEHVGPWRAGLSGGFTRRANSALLLSRDPGAAVDALDELERTYRAAGLPCIVRMPTAASPEPPEAALVAELARRGYRTGVVTRVLARRLDDGRPDEGRPARPAAVDAVPPGVAVTGDLAPDDAWLGGWLGTKAATSGAVGAAAARRLLTGSPATYLTATHETPEAGSAALGTIRVAHAGPWAALSCLAVAPPARRRGLGRALTLTALAVGRDAGASAAFLQVEVGNEPAVTLYEGLGFVEVDEYAYLHAPVAGP